METLPYIVIGFGACLFCFNLGRMTKAEPSEEVMFDRLVRLRSARKIEGLTREELENQIEKTAEAQARRMSLS